MPSQLSKGNSDDERGVAGSAKSLDEERDGISEQNGGEEVTEDDMEPRPEEKVEDSPPNGGYGWVMVACIATINA